MRSLIPKVKILSAGAAPLVAAFCREIKLRDTIDEMVTWDPKQCRLSPGTLLEALVINILVARKPLYRVEEFYSEMNLNVNDNLTLMSDKEIPFISRLPETFKISADLKEWAWAQNQWQHLGSLVEKKNASVYQVQSTVRELNGHDYRFIIVHSSSLDKRKEKSINKKIDIKKKELIKGCNALAKREFYCEADAIKESELFLAKHDTSLPL
jgi:hypothetical protein